MNTIKLQYYTKGDTGDNSSYNGDPTTNCIQYEVIRCISGVLFKPPVPGSAPERISHRSIHYNVHKCRGN